MKTKALQWLLLIALTCSLAKPPLAAQSDATAPASVAAAQFDIPATDDGLPGSGPIRRYDWFRRLWKERRSAWARRVERDQKAVVLLGDSITQGWGEDFTGYFPGMKLANRGISG